MQSIAQVTPINNVILKKNELAPFEGVLVSEPRFRYYMKQDKLAEELSKIKIEPCPPQKECEVCQDYNLLSGLGGFTLGVSFMAIVGALTKK